MFLRSACSAENAGGGEGAGWKNGGVGEGSKKGGLEKRFDETWEPPWKKKKLFGCRGGREGQQPPVNPIPHDPDPLVSFPVPGRGFGRNPPHALEGYEKNTATR